jgi:hypothetical protein
VNGNFKYPNQSSWPLWISEAVEELDNMSDRPEWRTCVAAWLEMEHQLGYPKGMVSHLIALFLLAFVNVISPQKKEHRLNNDGRPEAIGTWQKSGQKYNTMPDLSDELPSFSISWWKWWRSLQPSW